jgi:hypothetical protein
MRRDAARAAGVPIEEDAPQPWFRAKALPSENWTHSQIYPGQVVRVVDTESGTLIVELHGLQTPTVPVDAEQLRLGWFS